MHPDSGLKCTWAPRSPLRQPPKNNRLLYENLIICHREYKRVLLTRHTPNTLTLHPPRCWLPVVRVVLRVYRKKIPSAPHMILFSCSDVEIARQVTGVSS